jgi:UTP--glucose-1-phosphate uridylyltransferase
LPKIRKAVVPAAGLGTRLLPATAAVPKELLPVGLKPMIQHCLEEAIGSGIEEIALILSPPKRSIRAYLDFAASSDVPNMAAFRDLLSRCQLHYLDQPQPRGVADALRLARDFTGPEAFAVLLPDNVTFAGPPVLAQMWPHLEDDRCALALTEYRKETAAWFGNCGRVDCTPLSGPKYRISRLHDKGKGTFRIRSGTVELVGYARYVLQPHFYDYISVSAVPPGGAELDDTPILQAIIQERGITGIQVQGHLFDAGHPGGYQAANRFAGTGGGLANDSLSM